MNLPKSRLQSVLKEHVVSWKKVDDFLNNAFHFYIFRIVVVCSSLKLVFAKFLSHLNIHLKMIIKKVAK